MRKKTFTVLASLALIAGFSGSASAALVTFTGDTTNGPTFNRPLEDLSGLSVVGTATHYSVYSFTVSISGNYTFVSSADLPPLWDNFTLLYANAFNPATPLTNAIKANDDNLAIGTSAFLATLTAGTPYYYVTTGFNNTDQGTFTNSINGPGAVVPEPTSLAAIGAMSALALRRRRSI